MDNTTNNEEIAQNNPPTTILSPSSWLNKVNFINHLTLFNNILTVLIAEKGAGKSAFAEILPKHLDSAIHCYQIKASSPFSAHQLLTDLSDSFHFSLATRFDLSTLVKTVNERQQHVLLLIDDAHHLEDSFIIEMLNVIKAQSQPVYFHFLLVSDYSILPLLNELSRNDYKDFIHTLELGPLSIPELSTYLKIKTYNIAGLKGLDDKKTIDEFYALTEGMIAEVNLHMMSFFSSLSKRKPPKRSGIPRFAKIAASFAILLAASSFFMQNADEMMATGKQLANQYIPSVMHVLDDNSRTILQAKTEVESFLPPLQLADESDIMLAKASQLPSIHIPESSPVPDKIRDAVYQARMENLAKHSLIPAIPKRSTTPAPNLQPSPKALAANPTAPHYRIQIAASPNAKQLENILKNHAVDTSAHIYKTLLKDKPWYVLTLGEFNKRAEANTAIKKLPNYLARYKPWIRSTETLAKATQYR